MSQDNDRFYDLDLADFQQVIGIEFQHEGLLRQALTHRSYINEQVDQDAQDNERLEFLGDAILDFITAEMLYTQFPGMTEGEMTRLRSALVRTESLARIALDCRVGEAMLIGKGEANSGGRERDYNLCCAFEALVGSIYLDRDIETVKAFVVPRLQMMLDTVMNQAILKDPRSQFQEWAQAELNITPEYRVSDTEGPEHEKEFIVEAYLEETKVAVGRGRSKRAAAQDAARVAIRLKEKRQLRLPPHLAQTDVDNRQ
jgi:ribonuclease III